MEEMILTLRCPKCNSSQVYFRSKENNYRCKKCGNTWIIEDKGVQENA